MTIQTCNKCLIQKSLDQFYLNPSKLSHRKKCKKCFNDELRDWTKAHPEHHNAKVKEWNRKNPEKFKEINQRNYKKQNEKRDKVKEKVLNDYPCLVCGENEQILLDFHHLDPTVKENSPSSHSLTWRKMLKEISKCVVLCCKCHRRYHAGKIQLPEPLIPIDVSRYSKSQQD